MLPIHKWSDCLVAVAIGTLSGALLGGVPLFGIALLSDRPVAEWGIGFLVGGTGFAVAGALYGYQAYRETRKKNTGGADV
jgi:hypothetical protein